MTIDFEAARGALETLEGFTDGPVHSPNYTRGAVDDESGNAEHNLSYDLGRDDLPPG